jgi:hypothetical protein
MDTKKCATCKKIKNIDDFHSDKSKKDGHGSRCKKCKMKYNKQWREENKDKDKENHKFYYETRKMAHEIKCSNFEVDINDDIIAMAYQLMAEKIKTNKENKEKARRDKLKSKILQDIEGHRKRKREYQMKWTKKNRDRVNADRRRFYTEHKNEINAKCRASYAKKKSQESP